MICKEKKSNYKGEPQPCPLTRAGVDGYRINILVAGVGKRNRASSLFHQGYYSVYFLSMQQTKKTKHSQP